MAGLQHILKMVCRAGAGLAFLILILAVLVQIIGRIVGTSPVWTEELTRFALLYMVAFGAGLSLLTHELVNVDVICDNLPAPWPKHLKIVSYSGILLLAVILAVPAWKFTLIGRLQTSPALGVRMDFNHVTVMILLLVLGTFTVLQIITILRGR